MSGLVASQLSVFKPIPVLLYHHVDDSGSRFSTSPTVFRQHLDWLAGHGYSTLTLDEVESVLVDPTRRSTLGRAVVLTFDDGHAELETVVAPMLRDYGFHGVAFLITDRCPAVTSDDTLSWNAIRQLAAEGVLEFHSHSHTHQPWPFDSTPTRVIRDDLARSREMLAAELERADTDQRHLAWPYGRSRSAWESAARELGFEVQYSVQRGAVTHANGGFRLPRLLADGMSLRGVKTWMMLLTSRAGAQASNKVFGTIRHARHGTGYF